MAATHTTTLDDLAEALTHASVAAERDLALAGRAARPVARGEGAVTSGAWSNSDRSARLPSDWAKRRIRVLRRDGFRCRITGPHCLTLATEVDHIVHGDDHRLGNLQAVCSRCHRAKTQAEAAGAQAAVRERSLRPAEGHPGAVTDSDRGEGCPPPRPPE